MQELTFASLAGLEKICRLKPLILDQHITGLCWLGNQALLRQVIHMFCRALEGAHLLLQGARLLGALNLQCIFRAFLRAVTGMLSEGFDGRHRALFGRLTILLANRINALERRVLFL